MERLIGKYIFDPEMTAGKMIFLTGPRQVGKTTFAQNVCLQRVLDKSGIEIREGFRSQIPFSVRLSNL